MKLKVTDSFFFNREIETVIYDIKMGLFSLLLIPIFLSFRVVFQLDKIPSSSILLLVIQLITIYFFYRFAMSLFKYEREDKAYEYMLSLPVSRWKILIWKTVPRLIAVFLVVSVVLIVSHLLIHFDILKSSMFFNPVFLFPFSIFFFLTCAGFSLFFTLEMAGGPWIITVTAFMALQKMIRLGLISLGVVFSKYTMMLISFVGTAFIVALVISTGFILTYRRLDSKSLKFHKKRFTWMVRPAMAIITVLGVYLLIRALIVT